MYGYDYQPFNVVEEEGVCMVMTTTTTRFLLSEVEQDVWAMVTAIPFPRRGRNVYGYDHQSFPFGKEKGDYMVMITTTTPFPLSERAEDI